MCNEPSIRDNNLTVIDRETIMKPRVLIVTTCRWFSAARLAMAFAQAGCTVDALCPAGHPAIGLKALHGWQWYHGLAPIASIQSSIHAVQPDIVFPCDDLAAIHLHRLYAQERDARSATSHSTLELLERSLGNPDSYPLIESRTRFLDIARDEGIHTPETALVSSAQQVRDWAAHHRFPAVLKADGTSGGEGVEIVQSLEQALRAYSKLRAPVSTPIVAKRALVDRDVNLLQPWFQRTKRIVSIQSFVQGRDANIAVACWQGSILASVGVEVISTGKKMGPAAVVHLVENDQMQVAAAKLVKRLNLSGLCGLDFMMDETSGVASLIEINARATQTCHLSLGPSRDLASALCSAITGTPLRRAPAVTDNETIALFPLAWQNDPSSCVLKTAYHDVPWEEPTLVRAGVAKQSWLTYENCVRAWSRIKLQRRTLPAEKPHDI
jgi:hypothetical protein